MRQLVYDGCAADRTQAVLLPGFQALRRVAPNHRISNETAVHLGSVGAVVRHPDEACEEAVPETPQRVIQCLDLSGQLLYLLVTLTLVQAFVAVQR